MKTIQDFDNLKLEFQQTASLCESWHKLYWFGYNFNKAQKAYFEAITEGEREAIWEFLQVSLTCNQWQAKNRLHIFKNEYLWDKFHQSRSNMRKFIPAP